MSPVCPQCGNSLDQDFGVVTCSKCQSVLFVDMDGNATTTSADVDSPPSEYQEAAPSPDNWLQDQSPESEPEPELEPEPIADLEPEFEPIAESPVESTDGEEEQPVPESDPYGEPEYNPNDLSEVSQFANSDQAFGALSYSVIIENIDTKEMRQLLLEALSDSKFAWDPKELMKQVKMGRLQLEDLNPVKASVLVQKLQDLPMKVSWVQNVFS